MNATVKTYFDAFNQGDVGRMLACLDDDIAGMLDCLSDDVAHHVNEGQVRVAKDKFRAFCEHMNRCYREELTDMVIFDAESGARAAAEFVVNGTYLATDEGLPEAHGQTYLLPAGSFFSLKNGKITRIVTYYNLADWIRQVS